MKKPKPSDAITDAMKHLGEVWTKLNADLQIANDMASVNAIICLQQFRDAADDLEALGDAAYAAQSAMEAYIAGIVARAEKHRPSAP